MQTLATLLNNYVSVVVILTAFWDAVANSVCCYDCIDILVTYHSVLVLVRSSGLIY